MAGNVTRRRSNDAAGADLDLSDYKLLAEFRFLLARFLAFSEDAAKAQGLAPRQHQALLAIKGHPGDAGITVGDLAERLCIRPHSAVGLVDRLVASGHLVRKGDPDDRRRIHLGLTAKGERVLAALSTAHHKELRRITPLLKPVLTQLGSSGDE
jgi:DNA-binding MarR family transcriptional regulator